MALAPGSGQGVDGMAPEIKYIELRQADGRPGVHMVDEVERWRVRIYPDDMTSADLEQPASQWGCSGDLLSQSADLSEAEIKWTEAGEQWVGFWASVPGPGQAS